METTKRLLLILVASSDEEFFMQKDKRMMTRKSRKLAIMLLIILFIIGGISGSVEFGGISTVAAATNISGQDGIGYSGSILGDEVLGRTFTGYQAWPSGFTNGSSAFAGGVYDGTNTRSKRESVRTGVGGHTG
jgi:hypothetical protein